MTEALKMVHEDFSQFPKTTEERHALAARIRLGEMPLNVGPGRVPVARWITTTFWEQGIFAPNIWGVYVLGIPFAVAFRSSTMATGNIRADFFYLMDGTPIGTTIGKAMWDTILAWLEAP